MHASARGFAAALRRRAGGRQVAIRTAPLGLLLAASLAGPAQAQRRGAGDLTGHLVNSVTREPIAGARVQLVGTRVALFTDTAGGFALRGLPSDRPITIEARAVGFRQGRFEVALPSDVPIERTFELEPVTVALDTVSVHSTPSVNWRSNDAFVVRQRRGIGYFITKEMIDERQANDLHDLLVIVPGVWTSCRAGRCDVQMLASGKNCTPEWFLDGFPATNAIGADFPARRIRAIEVYRSLFEVPPEFQRTNLRCGVIAVWSNMER